MDAPSRSDKIEAFMRKKFGATLQSTEKYLEKADRLFQADGQL